MKQIWCYGNYVCLYLYLYLLTKAAVKSVYLLTRAVMKSVCICSPKKQWRVSMFAHQSSYEECLYLLTGAAMKSVYVCSLEQQWKVCICVCVCIYIYIYMLTRAAMRTVVMLTRAAVKSVYVYICSPEQQWRVFVSVPVFVHQGSGPGDAQLGSARSTGQWCCWRQDRAGPSHW